MVFPPGFPNTRILHDVAAILGILAALLTFGRYFYNNGPKIVLLIRKIGRRKITISQTISFTYQITVLKKLDQLNITYRLP